MAKKTPQKPEDQSRDQQLGVMLTKAEKEAVRRFAGEMGMSLSTAGRYLVRQGLAASKIVIADEGE
jgi:hypothetical protein